MKHLQSNSELQEKALLFAIGALPEDERRDYARHLEEDGCPVCVAENLEFQNVAQTLALNLPEATPSAEVKERLMAGVQVESRMGDTRTPAVQPEAPRGRSVFQWTGWALAAAATIALVALMNNNANLQSKIESLNVRVNELKGQVERDGAVLASLTQPEVRVLNLAGQGDAPRARARIFWNESSGSWRVYIARLPQVPADRSYQLWFVPRAGNPVSAQVFNTEANGSATFEVQLPASATELKAAAVTTEPAGGLPQPSGAFVLLGGD